MTPRRQVNISISAEMYARLCERAGARGRTPAGQLKHWAEYHLAQIDPETVASASSPKEAVTS